MQNKLELNDEEDYANLKPLQERLLSILAVIHDICECNNLVYFAAAGTLLGAVRHHGFIPWDDDIDLMMPRRDFDIFSKIAKDALPDWLYLQSPENTCETFSYPIRVRDKNTTGMFAFEVEKKYPNKGIWVSIFPLDRLASPEREIKRRKRIHFLETALWHGQYRGKPLRKTDYLAKYYGVFRSMQKDGLTVLHQKLDAECKRRETSDVPLMGILTSTGGYSMERLQWDTACFDKALYVPFENMQISIPIGYDTVLTRQYDDYMTPPPKDQRRPQAHFYILDLERPSNYYTENRNKIDEYLATHANEFFGAPRKCRVVK